MKKLTAILLLLISFSFSLQAQTFSEVLDEIYGERENVGVDLSNADQNADHFFYYYIQFREGEDQPWQDWRRPEIYQKLAENLTGIDLYWSNQIYREGEETLSTLESFYSTDFIVKGKTLTWHPIMMSETWITGKVPNFMDMNVIWHKEITLESNQRIEYDYKIGSRNFKVFFGYRAVDRK